MVDAEEVQRWDVIVAGAGTAGCMAAIFAGRRGARVLLIEAADEIGGTLHIAGGMISAAGTKWQSEHGIVDSPDEHYEDVMRICQNTADPKIVRLAVDEAAKTFDWLTDHGLKMSTPKPVVGADIHESYRKERYGWGTEHGISILKIVRPQLMVQVARGRVDLRLRTRLTSLVKDEETGRIEGIRCVTGDGAEQVFFGANVVLATGGFGASPEMVQEIHHTPMYMLGAWPHDTGDGIRAGLEAGGKLRYTEHYLGNFGCVLTSSHYPSKVMATPVTSPKRRLPWEIYVDSTGRRFINECEPSVDKREHALIALPDKRYWIVFDQEILENAPPMIPDWAPEDFRDTFGNHEMFLTAPTLAELAEQTGMNATTLAATVDDYNANLAGTDKFGGPHRPRPVSRGPFYAVRMHCTPITSNPGLDVDDELRALDATGAPIPGLYLAGEVIGASATMGQSAVNGMLLTPAMAFGRLLGEKLLTWPPANAVRGMSFSAETVSP